MTEDTGEWLKMTPRDVVDTDAGTLLRVLEGKTISRSDIEQKMFLAGFLCVVKLAIDWYRSKIFSGISTFLCIIEVNIYIHILHR